MNVRLGLCRRKASESAMSSSSDGESDQFFETMEEIASTSASESSEGEYRRGRHPRRKQQQQLDPFADTKYAVWTSDLVSIRERRLRLLQKMGLQHSAALDRASHSFPLPAPLSGVVRSISDPVKGQKLSPATDSGIGDSVSSTDRFGDKRLGGCGDFSSTDSLNSSVPAEDGSRDDSVEGTASSANSSREFVCRIKDLDNGKEFIVHELGSDGLWNRLREVGTGKELSLEEFESSLGLSPLIRMAQPDPGSTQAKQRRKSWLKQLRGVVKRTATDSSLKEGSTGHLSSSGTISPWRMQRIKVRVCKKAVRELTELYMGQEIKAHQGPIWALKVSPGGRYLASGGQDLVVRVWEIVTNQESGELNLEASSSPSLKKRSSSRKKHGSHERPAIKTLGLGAVSSLHGHVEDILDLSWSPSEQFLLSSSMDATVRLWHIARQECLRIFSHNDYVTCIVFNPVDERYFLSGSLDGKVRIWSILHHHVVDWTDLRDIVTAASYTSDGTAAMVGTYKGICHFYDTVDNKLQADGEINVVGKKGKKITGIQCMPGDPSKMLITSNDSRIRLYEGTELVSKYKGFRNMSSQISASFSRNGSYIVSASEDSHVYMWNVMPPSTASCRGHLKISDKSCENFLSSDVTVAVPWSSYHDDIPDRQEHKKDDSRALKIGGDIFQLLKQTSFPGPCFDCLTVANASDGTSVFPVSDDTLSVSDLADAVSTSPNSCSGFIFADKKKLETVPLVVESDSHKEDTASRGGLGLVIVTASLSGQIRTFQNYGLPLHA